MAVYGSFNAYMYDVNTKTSIDLDLSNKDVRNLKVKNIYTDCGVRVEAKFDKSFFNVWSKRNKLLMSRNTLQAVKKVP